MITISTTKMSKLWGRIYDMYATRCISNYSTSSTPKEERTLNRLSVVRRSQLPNLKTGYFTLDPSVSTQEEFKEVTVTELMESNEEFRNPDYFQVHKLFTVKDLFDSRVHLGHKVGSLNPHMTDFIFGSRFETCIFDLDKTAFHLRQALNFVAHVAFRNGIIMFLSRSPQTMNLVEASAIECGEYAHCREWDIHTLTNSIRTFGGITRLPDTMIFLNTLDTVMAPHKAIYDAAKMLIPTVGIVDTNCNPNLITYPVPGNDDTPCAIQLYLKLFKEAIMRGKNKRKQLESKTV